MKASAHRSPSADSKKAEAPRTGPSAREQRPANPALAQLAWRSAQRSQASSAGGLPAPVAARMEHAFGADFSGVRVRESDEASSLGAVAFTRGTNIVFAPGHYQPGSPRGDSLIGHELAHVVQQSEGRVAPTIQASGLHFNADSALEAEADSLGARAARGEIVRAQSAAAAPGQALTQLKPAGTVIQLAPQPGKYGQFIDKEYTLTQWGCRIVLEFDPLKNVADATKIGLAQAVRSEGGAAPNPTIAKRTTQSGWHLDRFPDQTNPVYGAKNLGPGKGLEATDKSEAPFGAKAEAGKNTTYILGSSHGGSKTSAFLYDKPEGPAMNNDSNTFETAALALEGEQKGTYYGSVEWGWKRDGSGKLSLIPFRLVSGDRPSANFMGAAQEWNKSKSQGKLVTTKNPTRCYKLEGGRNFVPEFTVALGVEVNYEMMGGPSNDFYNLVTIKTGNAHVGDRTWIKVGDLSDTGGGTPVTPLPP